MRISVSNWQTSPEDVKKTVDAVERAFTSIRHRKDSENLSNKT
jgi:hypothetical protein